jgi:hypothetical protein
MFKDSLKDPHKSKISFLDTSLQRAMDYFDFISKRRALLVFYEPTDKMRTPVEVYFLQDHGEEIEKNFAFIGVTAQSQEKDLILPFLPRQDVPIVVAFYHNELGRLTAIESLPLTQDNLKNKPLIRAYLKKMSEVAEKSAETFERGFISLQKHIGQAAGQSSQRFPDEGHYDPYDDENEDYGDRMARVEQQNLRKQASTDRHVKNDQDQAYAETLKKIEADRRKQQEEIAKKKAESEALMAKQHEKEAFMTKLANEKVDPAYLVTLQFRFPSGQKVVRDFDRRSKVSYAHMFAGTFENKGFEEPNAGYQLSAGFPPKALDPEATLESVFGTSDSEVVHVKEV